jgi:uncharacterized cupin superfamily protein
MAFAADDGTEFEYGPGDAFAAMAERHDAWTVGDQPCVIVFVAHESQVLA